jgi:hypothetical protein
MIRLTFFINTWSMHVHEITGFDTDLSALDQVGRWQPDIVGDWTGTVTPLANLREVRSNGDSGQPFQGPLVISRHTREEAAK